jgi:ankyrin repeat protein
MTVPHDIVGQFVDAAVDNHALADDLLRRYPDLKSARWVGDSILRFLAIENFPLGVQFLAARGWPINETDDLGATPLHDAIRAHATDAALALIELGANPNAYSETYDNPLHCAIAAGDATIVRALINFGANPNYTTCLGESPYDVLPGVRDSTNEIMKILMACGLPPPDA